MTLRPTERAGHGREIARDAARGGRPLVVSVSGDGGYNDVVNGLMEAGADAAYAAVLAAGNANDHRRVTRERPLADAIVDGDVSRLDLLKLTVDDDARSATRTPTSGSASPRRLRWSWRRAARGRSRK